MKDGLNQAIPSCLKDYLNKKTENGFNSIFNPTMRRYFVFDLLKEEFYYMTDEKSKTKSKSYLKSDLVSYSKILKDEDDVKEFKYRFSIKTKSKVLYLFTDNVQIYERWMRVLHYYFYAIDIVGNNLIKPLVGESEGNVKRIDTVPEEIKPVKVNDVQKSLMDSSNIDKNKVDNKNDIKESESPNNCIVKVNEKERENLLLENLALKANSSNMNSSNDLKNEMINKDKGSSSNNKDSKESKEGKEIKDNKQNILNKSNTNTSNSASASISPTKSNNESNSNKSNKNDSNPNNTKVKHDNKVLLQSPKNLNYYIQKEPDNLILDLKSDDNSTKELNIDSKIDIPSLSNNENLYLEHAKSSPSKYKNSKFKDFKIKEANSMANIPNVALNSSSIINTSNTNNTSNANINANNNSSININKEVDNSDTTSEIKKTELRKIKSFNNDFQNWDD